MISVWLFNNIAVNVLTCVNGMWWHGITHVGIYKYYNNT